MNTGHSLRNFHYWAGGLQKGPKRLITERICIVYPAVKYTISKMAEELKTRKQEKQKLKPIL